MPFISISGGFRSIWAELPEIDAIIQRQFTCNALVRRRGWVIWISQGALSRYWPAGWGLPAGWDSPRLRSHWPTSDFIRARNLPLRPLTVLDRCQRLGWGKNRCMMGPETKSGTVDRSVISWPLCPGNYTLGRGQVEGSRSTDLGQCWSVVSGVAVWHAQGLSSHPPLYFPTPFPMSKQRSWSVMNNVVKCRK